MAPFRTLILALAAAAATGAAQAQGCSKPIVIVTEEWPGQPKAARANEGADIDMARAIVREAGCTLVAGPMLSPTRRIALLAEGRFDMMLSATDLPERRQFARFTAAYRRETIGLFTLEKKYEDYGDVDGFDVVDTRKLQLLVPAIGWYGTEYERRRGALEAHGRLSFYATVPQGLSVLAANRAEIIMGDTLAIRLAARAIGVPVRQLGFVVSRTPVHLMLSRATTTEKDIAALDAAIARLEKNGTLRAIGLRYGLN